MRYISILRGINVGGKRKILMADLADLFRELGFSDIVTYIQSGNVIFSLKHHEYRPKVQRTEIFVKKRMIKSEVQRTVTSIALNRIVFL